jgi:hypothetical protein
MLRSSLCKWTGSFSTQILGKFPGLHVIGPCSNFPLQDVLFESACDGIA